MHGCYNISIYSLHGYIGSYILLSNGSRNLVSDNI